MEPTGVERHRLQNPRGEGRRAGSERIKAFGVSTLSLPAVAGEDFRSYSDGLGCNRGRTMDALGKKGVRRCV
jgi:hypothetical protein